MVYLVFTEGYAATAGDDWTRPELCNEAMRLGRLLAEIVPDESEVHGLLALMELQASRIPARVGPSGEAVLLPDQDRSRWDALLVRRNGEFYLDDLGSLNGTYVNRRRIESHRLADGDELQVGKYKLTFLQR